MVVVDDRDDTIGPPPSCSLRRCPQSLRILGAGGVSSAYDEQGGAPHIQYDRPLAVVAVLDGPSELAGPGAVQLDVGPSFVADNGPKGLSEVPALTLHASAALSTTPGTVLDTEGHRHPARPGRGVHRRAKVEATWTRWSSPPRWSGGRTAA